LEYDAVVLEISTMAYDDEVSSIRDWLTLNKGGSSEPTCRLVAGGAGLVVMYGSTNRLSVQGVVEVTLSEIEEMAVAEGEDGEDRAEEGACGIFAGGAGISLEKASRSLDIQVRVGVRVRV
jgi:hypothetical protein